jgi:hypothetical protein
LNDSVTWRYNRRIAQGLNGLLFIGVEFGWDCNIHRDNQVTLLLC